ncbi:EF-hand calcium-binding domain-containing protein 7-like isoform X2 [Physella acuta]|uniref:EF-hand calcium-binding domain-containing protein 7-like isoform X2 n=1 Tax=Physella acuta TaxID=109671 RepID=UPI0027DB5E6E|nr:EF-hand calcium-binding domain-containing protein 7-like isoform X2 [Physella acuta]
MSSQRRLSRPSTATSVSSRTSADNELKLECRAAFLAHYDTINEKVESKDDLMLLLQQTGRNPSRKIISKYWTPKTDYITFEDFVDICKREPVTSEEDLIKAFRKIDLNGDGFISLDELLKVLTTRGEKMTRPEVKALIDEVDENKDGKLNYKEKEVFDYNKFTHLMMTTTEDYKKMAIKALEKKERQKLKSRDGEITPRKDSDQQSMGSQLSINSTESDRRQSKHDQSPDLKSERSMSNFSMLSRNSNESSPDQSPEPKSERRMSNLSVRGQKSNATSLDRRASKQSISGSLMDDEFSRPSPRVPRETRPKSSSKGGRQSEPSNLREWSCVQSKGTFFLENTIISHTYKLIITEATDAWMTIQPLRIGESGESLDGTVVDTALFVLNENGTSLIAYTESKDSKGKYSLRCNLSKGNYLLIPFSTGCRLKPGKNLPTKEAKLITKDKEDRIILTPAFRKALKDIFEMADLDGNGLLSRNEFNWYNLRTSGEEIADDEWQVVEDNIELDKGQITPSGFIKLNEMEADDNEGDTEDLWITLTAMGFNKSLLLDESCPFLLKVYTQDCDTPKLKVIGLESNKEKIDKAVCELAITKGEPVKVKGLKDVTVHQYTNDHRAMIVVDNKSRNKLKIALDCSKSRGVVSHTGSLMTTVNVPSQSAVVGHHLLPLYDAGEFSVVCEESVLK